MVKICPPSPNLNLLDVDEEYTYADTATETWQVIKFFLNELKPVNPEDLGPEERKCHICAEDFTTRVHGAVRLPCNHIFGESCIKIWLRPYARYMPIQGERWGEPVGANNCPLCRQVFFPKQEAVDILPLMQTRIELWDKTYAHFGIALSDTERQAREDILRYLKSYGARSLDVYYPYFTVWSSYVTWAHERLLKFSRALKSYPLTPVQQHLRQCLEQVAREGFPGKSRWRQNNQGDIFFQIDDSETEQDSESDESEEEVEAEEESEELAEGDT